MNTAVVERAERSASRLAMRIAVVTETYPPEVNGVALTAARFVESLRDLGHAVQVFRPRQAADRKSDRSTPGDTLTRGVRVPFYRDLQMGLPASSVLTRCWGKQRPDVVHIVTEGPLGWSALRTARSLGIPVISDFRTNFHAYTEHYGASWLGKPILGYLRRFHNRTRATLVPTSALRDELHALGFTAVQVVARGVDTALFNPSRRDATLRRQWGAQPADPVFLHVGRLAPEKNPAVLGGAYAAALAVAPRAKLVLVGDGPAREEFLAACPGAIHAGVRRGDDLAAHYASADVFLFPSLTETFGNVTLEAMASGLAVVAFDYAAAHELLRSGSNGFAVPLDHPAGFALAAQQLAESPECARAIGRLAHCDALARDWTAVARTLEAILAAAADWPTQTTQSVTQAEGWPVRQAT